MPPCVARVPDLVYLEERVIKSPAHLMLDRQEAISEARAIRAGRGSLLRSPVAGGNAAGDRSCRDRDAGLASAWVARRRS